MKIYHYDAFSNQPDKGNPAGVVLEADNLSESEMQKIATAVGFNETAFICSSDKADIRIRYFTPGHEMDLCGHGTVASLVALCERKEDKKIEKVETKAGVIDVKIIKKPGEVRVVMKQIPAKFIDFTGDIEKIAWVLGLEESDIEKKWPVVYGSTGIWTLVVPVKKLESFKKMKPKTKEFPGVLEQFSTASIHPFCLETYNDDAEMHGRHFSPPIAGTVEDPVTGTASGVMGAYYLKYIKSSNSVTLNVEQGQEINKNGCVTVNVERVDKEIEVEIEGTGIFVKELFL